MPTDSSGFAPDSSDRNSPRQDDALREETEPLERSGRSPRTEEWRDPEPSGEDQADVGLQPYGPLAGGTPDGMSAEDVDQRSRLAQHLGKSVYPADRDELLRVMRGNNAPDDLLERVEQLPEGRVYRNVQEISEDLGLGVEQHRS